ncbi:flagellar biosynthesis protein FlhB [Fictibacillus macauensis ZFHKF-1]|uniref:Flagellar biosynthetic protein FlhB n=1 Tax=Fictibacillus macauensis ZFHKF-1 TaxID=1196324 RepID=I8UE72_9BACL|nr:flagellar biosynthesis protein FlhB [Fictibacillus macauensis]EIT85098.1 flagellar biosynthesis protein FlhB [Fictibacillus macauensis ZFHKF-1]
MRLQLDLHYFSGEKTEQATPKKREETKKKGQVAKSADLNAAATLLASFLALLLFGESMAEKMMNLLRVLLSKGLVLQPTEENVHLLFANLVKDAVVAIAPVLVMVMVAGILANYLQIGWLFSMEAISMKWNRLNPLQGAKKIYSLRALVELVKSMLKISVIGGVTFFIIYRKKEELMKLSQVSLKSSLSSFGELIFEMGLFASILMLLVALLDYMYQKFDFEKSIRMSKQEIKDEHKKIEGDPKIKAKVKEKQRQLAMRRMMQDLPSADVIITNPTHYAIALKYDETKRDAPYVIAKGLDFVAQKMKEVAKAHNVTQVENRQLARTLYKETEIGDSIPEDLFKAVAEILAYVYQLKKKK